MPKIDPHTEAYRPGSRGINYRSEPFINRLDKAPLEDAHSYSSYTFGDPTTPWCAPTWAIPRSSASSTAAREMFHVFHLHGGGDPLALQPGRRPDVRLRRHRPEQAPGDQTSNSKRLDSQSIGPGESYNLEIEGGAGGVQQAAGDFSCTATSPTTTWPACGASGGRTTRCSPTSCRCPTVPRRAAAVDSAGLIGRTMPDGTTITKDNLDDWIRPQLPAAGKQHNDQDAAVWNWKIDTTDPDKPVYLDEPEDTSQLARPART